ncbi:MAG: iron-containing alcohol dehydrogenase, partial [Dehalococcoidia bacterium]|nr:iron-containing alcohol dehydrogenase [Dehalococcoidia bacterium]
MTQFSAYMPVEIRFGPGTVSSLGEAASRLGRRAFLVTMKNLVEIGLVERAIDSLKKSNIEFVLFDKVKGEPKSSDIDSAKEVLRESGCDLVIGLGGGSCIDQAKALAICARHPEPIWEYVNLSNRPPKPVSSKDVLPIIAIPTTAGTGSEVTPYAVVTNTETIQKGTIKEPAIYARMALIDPELTVPLPPRITAATGVDALAHAIESYFNVKNRTPYSDMVAVEAIRQIIKWLPTAYQDGNNLEARTRVAWGATLGGISISQAGTTVAHAMAQPLGARMG